MLNFLQSIFFYFASTSDQHKDWVFWEKKIAIWNTLIKLLLNYFKTFIKIFSPSSQLSIRIHGKTWMSDTETFLTREGKPKLGTDSDRGQIWKGKFKLKNPTKPTTPLPAPPKPNTKTKQTTKISTPNSGILQNLLELLSHCVRGNGAKTLFLPITPSLPHSEHSAKGKAFGISYSTPKIDVFSNCWLFRLPHWNINLERRSLAFSERMNL